MMTTPMHLTVIGKAKGGDTMETVIALVLGYIAGVITIALATNTVEVKLLNRKPKKTPFITQPGEEDEKGSGE